MDQSSLWTRYESSLINDSLTQKRRDKLKAMFSMVERGLGVPYEEATREDIEAFLDRMNRGKFRKLDGKPYSGSTKADVKRFLKQFFKWLRGDGERLPPEVAWIKARIGKDERPKEPPLITQEDILKVAQHFRRPDFRLMTLLLFDSGFRISEMFSVRKDNLTWEAFDKDGRKCWWVECNESKTYPRKVDVGLFTDEISQYANTAPYRKLGAKDPLFPFSDTLYRAALRQAVNAALGGKVRVTPHALRHSSATLYAALYSGDRVRLAERYGWSYSAQELDTYVRRNSGRLVESAQISYDNEVTRLKEEVKDLKAQMTAIAEALARSPEGQGLIRRVSPR